MSDQNVPPNPKKSSTIAELVQRAAMGLDGVGLDEVLLGKAVILCESQMDRIAASSLHSVLTTHIDQLKPLKPARKLRKAASDTHATS